MKVAKQSIFTILFSIIGFGIVAQTTISGKVTNEEGEPMSGVSIYLFSSYDGASSSNLGDFNFKTDKKGSQTLQIESMGYKSVSRKVELNGDTVFVQTQLERAFNQLEAVTITAGTFEASDKKKAITISSLDMVTTAGASGDLFGALQYLPGTTTNGESGRLFVKGGDSQESQTYIDGALVTVPYTSSPANQSVRGRFNPFMFKGTVFSTGGYSAEYGQALSSVLLLTTNDMPAEDQIDISVLSIGSDVAGTKLWENGAITASLGYSNLAPYMKVAPQNYKWEKAPESLTGAVNLLQKTKCAGMFKLYSSIDKSQLTVKKENLDIAGAFNNFNLENRNFFINSSWNGMISKKLLLNSSVSYTKNQDQIQFEQNNVEEKIEAAFLKSTFSYTFNQKTKLKFGGDISTKTFTQNVRQPLDTISNFFTNNQASGFGELQVYASTKLMAQFGGRIEYSDYLQHVNASPRVSAAYKISSKSQFSAAYGWFYQNPTDNYLLFTNQLTPERADHYTFSFQSAMELRTFRIELYYKDYKNLTKIKSAEFYLPTSYANNGNGYAKGLDLFWRDRQTIKNGDYWISYSYLDTKRNYRNFPIAATPTFASAHNFSVVYKHWLANWRSYIGVNLKYASPRNFNNPNSPIFNGEKMLPYRSLDVSWSYLYRKNVIFYGAITNLPGFKNEFGQSYSSVPDTDGKYKSSTIKPGSNRFFIIACFITLTRKGDANQLEKIQ